MTQIKNMKKITLMLGLLLNVTLTVSHQQNWRNFYPNALKVSTEYKIDEQIIDKYIVAEQNAKTKIRHLREAPETERDHAEKQEKNGLIVYAASPDCFATIPQNVAKTIRSQFAKNLQCKISDHVVDNSKLGALYKMKINVETLGDDDTSQMHSITLDAINRKKQHEYGFVPYQLEFLSSAQLYPYKNTVQKNNVCRGINIKLNVSNCYVSDLGPSGFFDKTLKVVILDVLSELFLKDYQICDLNGEKSGTWHPMYLKCCYRKEVRLQASDFDNPDTAQTPQYTIGCEDPNLWQKILLIFIQISSLVAFILSPLTVYWLQLYIPDDQNHTSCWTRIKSCCRCMLKRSKCQKRNKDNTEADNTNDDDVAMESDDVNNGDNCTKTGLLLCVQCKREENAIVANDDKQERMSNQARHRDSSEGDSGVTDVLVKTPANKTDVNIELDNIDKDVPVNSDEDSSQSDDSIDGRKKKENVYFDGKAEMSFRFSYVLHYLFLWFFGGYLVTLLRRFLFIYLFCTLLLCQVYVLMSFNGLVLEMNPLMMYQSMALKSFIKSILELTVETNTVHQNSTMEENLAYVTEKANWSLIIGFLVSPLIVTIAIYVFLFNPLTSRHSISKILSWKEDYRFYGQPLPDDLQTEIDQGEPPLKVAYKNMKHRMYLICSGSFWRFFWRSFIKGDESPTSKVKKVLNKIKVILKAILFAVPLIWYSFPIFSITNGIQKYLKMYYRTHTRPKAITIMTLNIIGAIIVYCIIADFLFLHIHAFTFLALDILFGDSVSFLIFIGALVYYLKRIFDDVEDEYIHLKGLLFEEGITLDEEMLVQGKILLCTDEPSRPLIERTDDGDIMMPRYIFSEVSEMILPLRKAIYKALRRFLITFFLLGFLLMAVVRKQSMSISRTDSEIFIALFAVAIPKLIGLVDSQHTTDVAERKRRYRIRKIFKAMTVMEERKSLS
ncbi:unnamed protein product [Owenia fusiformis]|uniref:Uncharacterized protein n=1 Tax=Owenia fusiformis TaxID=6347 RepID=A0A8J1UCW7_OWEFU|nr:unnamed protein product [Owenia fusiformis]